MAERPLYTLYKNLKAQNYDVPDDYNKFESALTRDGKDGADNRHAIYENLKAQNFDVPSTYERFYSALFEPRSKTSSRAKGGSVPISAADRARFLAGAQSALNTARQVKRASGNIRKTVERAKKFDANDGKVTIGFKNPLQNQNVQKNKYNYNATTGKTGTYTTSDGVEFDNEYDATQYQNQLDEQGQQYINAVNAGEIPSVFDVRDKNGNYDLQENIGKNGTYLTKEGAQKQFDKKLADAYARKNEIEAAIAEDHRLHGNPLLSYGASIGASNGRTDEQSDYSNKLATSLALVKQQIGALEAVKQYPTSNWSEDALKALDNTAFTAKTWDFGLTDFATMGQMERIKTKMDNNIPLSGSDKMLLKSKLGADAAAALEDEKMGNIYSWTKIAGQSLPFMFDFFLTGGYGGITKGISRGALKFAAKRGMGKVSAAILKNTGIVAGDVIGSYAMAGTEQALKTGADIMQRHLGNLYQDEQGNYKFGTFDENGNLLHEGGESMGTALYKGLTSAMVENYTEKLFGHNYGIKKGSVNFMEKHGMNASAEFFKNIGKSGWYTNSKKWMEKFGINGFAEEVMEEEIGIPLHALLDGEGKVSDLLDARQQLDIIGGMAISVGSMYAIGAGSRPVKGIYNRAQYYRFRNKVNVADSDAQNLMGDSWADIKDKIDNATNEQMGGVLADILRQRDTMTKEQINAAVNYGINLMKMRGYNIAKTAEMHAREITNEPTTPEEKHQADIDNAYSEGRDAYGYDTHEIQLDQEDKQKSLAQLLGISEQQLASMSDEELEAFSGRDDNIDRAIYDYQLSSARYKGVVDDAQDKIDLAAHQAEQRVDMYTDQSRGSVRNATIKASGGLEDYGVYIISGNIATNDDGSIDVSNSDDMILYYDPKTNSVEHADAFMFAELGEELPADDVKSQAVADAKENAIKEVAGIIDGTVEVGSQFSVTDADGTEHTYEVLADNGDGTAMITVDGNIPTELVNGENVQIPYSFADLQQMKDAEDLKRLEAAKAEREQMEKERAAQQTQQTQPSFDFNQILNDNGNVVLADVLGKDGNTKYPNSQLFLIRDSGAKAKVVELKSDGTLVPHAVNKKDVRTATTMTLDEYKQAFSDSSMIEDNSGAIEGDRGGIEVNDELPPVPDNVTINGDGTYSVDGAVQGGENTTAPSEQTEQTSAMTLEDGTIVPMLEDGNPDFSKLTADQIAELYDSQFGEDADSVISGWVSDAKKALDKANNMTVNGKNFVEQKAAKEAKEKAIADAQAAYDSAIAIRDAYNSRQLAKVEDTAEGRKNLIEKARRKFSRLKSAVKDDAEAVSQLYKDVVGSLLHRLYDGTGIDVTDTIPLTAEEYVASNLGAHSLNYEGTETSKGVKQETGLSREDFAKTQLLAADGKGTTIDNLVHSLWENRPSNLESLETQDIRNALIGVLTSGFKASEARNFVENIRIAQAENILEEQKRAQENAAYAEQQKAEQEAELEAKSDEKAELQAKSEEKLDNESSNESNDLSNETNNEKTNDNINDNINVPEDATDENPLGAQRDESDLPFSAKENGKKQTTAERAADVEKNKVDDMKVVDNIVGQKTRKTLEKLAKMMGANVQWQYSDKNANGWFDDKTNTIYLTLDSSITEGVQFIFGHEMTHEMRTKNPAAYDELKTLVKDMMGEDAFNSETDKMQIRYKKGGARYWNDRNAIEEEVVADQLGIWIRDANYAHTLLLKMSHPLLARLHEIVNSFLMDLHGTEFSDDMRLILRSIEQAYVKTANREAVDAATQEGEVGQRLSLRTKPEPKKTQKVYKLMRLGEDGKLYPLFIGSGEAIELGKWYDADSPKLQDLTSLSSKDYVGTRTAKKDGASVKEEYHYGAYIVNNKTGEAMSLADFKAKYSKQFARMGNNPNKKAVDWATDNGYRWIKIEEKNQGQSRYGGEARSYYNYGINGSGSVSIFAMRPGWHAGSLPTMRQIGKGSAKNLRDDTFVWVEGEIPAEIDYNEEAQKNADKDIPDHIPTDGYYLKATNANKEASQADKVGWYVAGAFRANRIMSDKETRDIIDEWNATHPDDNVEYDWKRESGKDFNAKTMSLEDTPKFSLKVYHGSGADFTEFDFDHMGEGAGSQVFGWGGYVTSSKKIGKSYANLVDANAPHQDVEYVGNNAHEYTDVVAGLFNGGQRDYDDVKEFLQNGYNSDKDNARKKQMLEWFESTKPSDWKSVNDGKRNLYEVDIPEDNGSNYLEWYGDVPSNLDKEKLAELILDKTGAKEKVARFKATPAYLKALEFDIKNRINEAKTGQRLYVNISSFVSEKDASEILSALGYTGIKYPAGTIMGGAKKGDVNYVIFKPEDMRITEHTKFSLKDIKPVGKNKFGDVYDQFKGKPKEAFDFLLKNKDGYLKGVFHRDEIGDIDLGYGEAPTPYTGYGLAHIIRKHVELMNDFDSVDDAVNAIIDVISNGKVEPINKDRVYEINKDIYRVAIAKDENGNWVLSAMDKSRSKKQKLRDKSKKGAATVVPPSLPSDGAGAVAPNLSAAKIDNSSETAKENGEKFSLKDEKIKSVAKKFGVNEDDVAMYANAVERGSTAEAARARANIKRYLLQANEDKISSFKDIIKYTKPINESLKENFGYLDAMIEERRKQVEAQRNAMEAARKRAQEEEEKRQKHLDELSLIPTDELDKRYMDAIANNDESTAREMLDESARRKGYGDADSDYQGQGAWAAPSNPQYESDEARRADIENSPDVNLEDIALGYNLQPDDYFDNPIAYMNNTAYGLESAHVIKNALDAIKNGEKDVKVKVYRAVPTSVKEGKLRNGDWVTPSKKYAEMHGDNRLDGKYRIIEDEVPANQLWWDGNDANEFGFDDGKEYRYKNAKNNRKLNDLITYDNKGNVIPPSKRFNSRKSDIRFSLAGERGAAAADKAEERTTRMDFLSVARKMEEEKKDAKAIKIATGWERGADGKWRFEIPDFHFNYEKWKDNNKEILDSMDDKDYRNVMRYENEFYEDLSPIRKKNFDELRRRTGYKIKQELTLGDVLEGNGADTLFKYYPELRDVKFKFSNLGAATVGIYDSKTKTIEVNDAFLYSPRKAERNLQHEVQHVIQHLEGFAKGGNQFKVRGEVKKKFSEITKQIRQLRAEGKEDEAKALIEKNRGLYNAYTKNDDYNSYKSLAGEVEARNVQERMNMTSEERRKTLAESTEDVARKDQIFLGVGDVSFSLRDMADGKESGADDMAEDLKSLNTPDEVDDAIKTAIDDMPSGWQMANKKMIHIAQALGENRKAEIAGEEPKFSLKDGTLIKAGTYFSGGGLVEEGLKGIIDPVVAVEYDEKISGVYRNNFGQHIVTADVRDVDPKELVKQIDGEVEYFHASPVCKNYSQAKSNHAEVELDKETAASTAEFINAVKPKVVTIENVKGYKDSEAMKIITDALDANGYTWDADVYNAADYGGYTNRERLIVRSVRDGKLPAKPKKMAHKSGWYEAVADIIQTLTEKKNGVAPWMDVRLKDDGIDWRNIDKPLYVMGSAYADGKVPHAFADELLPTLRTKSGDVIVMPDGKVYRAMGRVLARVSGVSDDYKMPFSENLSHTIIGNGIPTQLTEHVIAPLLTGSDPKFSIRTYHGTGASFDKFDLSHALEGEGSETFGHGVYVTNSKKIGDNYAQRAKDRKGKFGFDYKIDMSADAGQMLSHYINKNQDVDKGLENARQDLKSALEMFPDDETLKELSAILKKNNNEIAEASNEAYLYDVDIPDDNGENYLGWNESQNFPLEKWYRLWEITHDGFNENEYFKDGGARYDLDRIERITQMKLESPENGMQKLPTLKGEELYHALEDFFDRERPLRGAKLASRALSEIGFVGIKYPAGMIHGGAEEGDYNYVIFDENNANIVGNTRFSLRYDQFEHDLNQWKKDNNLPKDAQRPTIPQRNAGESAVDFLRRVDEYRKQMALWKTAPTYEQHLLSDDTALGEFNRELQRGSVLKRIAFQDSMLAIRKAQEAIMKEVGVDRLNMAEDAYTAENRSHGKGKNEFEEYNNEFLQPLRKAYHQMKKVLGDSYDNVRIYMMAKHGLERDAQMAFKKSLEADYEDVNQRSAAYKAYKNDLDRVSNDADLEFGRVDFTTWRQKDNAIRGKYSPSYMDYRYDDNGIVFDYSGLSSLFDGSDFEEAAHRLVRNVETKHLAEVQALWNATNAATKKILRDGYKAGMMSKDTYQYVRDMYSHYIPLRGWDGTTADQVWEYVGGGKGAFNQTLKTAHGRTSIADDPIAYIENMAESGILLNNKNWVKQHLMLLAQNHPTSLLTLSKAWYVKSTDANGNEEWIPATPQITSQMNSNQVKSAIDVFDQKMEQLAQTGDATQQRDGLNIAYPQTHSEEREHEVRVMKDGEEYVIYVNGDPQLAQAMNNTRAHRVREIQSGKLDRAAAWLGRKMAAAYTSLSPLFIPSNYFRDLTMTLASTAIREDAKYNYLLRKNLATSWNLGFMLRDFQNGKLREKVSNGNATPKEQMFYDFMMNGGETGFVSSLDVEDLKKKFKNDLKDLDKWKANPVKVGHTIMDIIEFLNRMIEDSNRFAVYMTSIQYGRSIDEAVNDAKDVTLNFNRKGTGEYGWQTIRNLYLFINPAVQSLQTLGALAKHHPFKFTAVTASWIASGVLVPIVNAALMKMAAAFLGGDGDDDKDLYKDISKKYWQFSKWDRRNNFIMWVPTTHEFVKIPLAQEFRAFYGLGDMIASKMMGGELAEESWSQYAEDLLGQVVDMLPLDPTGYDGNIAVSLMPNAIRPVFELAFNVDFTGKPLFKDTEYNKYDPNFTKAYVGTPDWLVRASRMMNSIGNDYPDVQQNKWDALGNPRFSINNPAVVDHVLSSYLGGAYTMGSQVLGLITKSLNDQKEIKVADIPLFSKFVSNPDDRPVTKKQGDEFWNMKENHDRAANTLSKLKKQAKVDGDYSMLERFYGSEEYKQYKQDDVKVKKYEEDKKKERAEESGEEYRPHKLNADDIYKAHATPKDDFEDLKLKQLYTKLNGFKTSYDLLVDTAPSQSDGYYNTNKAAIDAIDEISLDKQEISELKKGFLDDGKDAYNAEDMKRIRELRKRILSVLEPASKVVVAKQKAKAEKK